MHYNVMALCRSLGTASSLVLGSVFFQILLQSWHLLDKDCEAAPAAARKSFSCVLNAAYNAEIQ